MKNLFIAKEIKKAEHPTSTTTRRVEGGEYITEKTTYVAITKLAHAECGHVFEVEPNRRQPQYTCPHCGKSSRTLIASKEIRKEAKEMDVTDYYGTPFDCTGSSILHVSENENGIRFSNQTTTMVINGNTVDVESKEKTYLEFILGQRTTGMKVMKRTEDKAIDAFEACGVNSHNIYNVECVYDGFDNAEEFIASSKWLSKINFLDILAHINVSMSFNSLLVLTAIVLSSYPQLELLLKMKYYKLFNDILTVLQRAYNKQMLASEIKRFERLFDIEATKGKNAMRLPTYIGEYLQARNADIEEYLVWCDIYQLTSMSKENFLELLNSVDFCKMSINKCIKELPKIIKYEGYSNVLKVCKYICKNNRLHPTHVCHLLSDYLELCSLHDIKIDLFPQDIEKLHDEVFIYVQGKRAEEKNNNLDKLATQVEEQIKPKNDKILSEDDLVAIVPHSVRDFLNEASQQRNCVGGYYRKLSRKPTTLVTGMKAYQILDTYLILCYIIIRWVVNI